MTKNTQNSTSGNKHTIEIPSNLQRFWEELQRKYFPEKFSIIDFESTDTAENYWRWHLDLKDYKSPINKNYRKNFKAIQPFADFQGNNDLKILFHPGYKHSNSLWIDLEQTIVNKGFFIPRSELNRLAQDKIEPYLLYLKLKASTFSFVELLKKTDDGRELLAFKEIPYPLIALWQYVPLYAKFLKTILTKNVKEFKTIRNTLARTYSPAGFDKKLPSQQIWELIQSEFQVRYFNGMTSAEQKDLVKNAHQSIQNFWRRYADSIRFIIENGYGAITPRTVNKQKIKTEKETAQQFFQLFKEELEWVKIQEIIDPYFENKYSNLPLDNTRWKFRPDRENIAEKGLEKAIGEKSILDRIKESDAAKVELIEPLFATPVQRNWIDVDKQKWYEFTPEERIELLASVKNDLNLFQQEQVDKAAQKRWNVYLQQFTNQLFSPFFRWEIVENEVIPQWNVLNSKRAIDLDKAFSDTQKKEIKERLNLQNCLNDLYAFSTLAKTEKFIKRVKKFSFPHLQNQWDKAVKAQLQTIRHKGAYRLKKMEEFGMLKNGQKPDKKLEQWLDELLQIEKEIGPYIPFVKKAFLMALPTQTSTEFDPYRHSHDGVEFDPETMQDQHATKCQPKNPRRHRKTCN